MQDKINPKQKIHKQEGIETYTQDMLDLLESNKGGLVKDVIHEQERQELQKKNFTPSSFRNRFFVITGIFLLFLAFAGIGFFIYNQKNDTVEIKKTFKPVIFLDKISFLEIGNLSKDKLVENILNKVNATKVEEKEIEGIYLTEDKKVIGFNKLITLLKGDVLIDSDNLIKDNFILGAINFYRSEKNNNIESQDKDQNKENNNPPATNPEITIEGEPTTLNSKALFKTGTTLFIDENAKEEAKKIIDDFLDNIDLNTSKIKVIGTYSIERPWIKNEEIAEERMRLGVNILMEVLQEKFSNEEIAQIEIEVSVKGRSIKDSYSEEEINQMTDEEVERAIDNTQGIEYLASAKTKSKTILVSDPEIPSNNTENTETKEKKVFTPKIKTSPDLFMLINVTSFSDIFPAMLQWEGKMFLDLHGFFDVSVSPETKYLLTKDFKNAVIQNKNARVLYDKNNEIVFMYVYINDNFVIITNTEEAVREVMQRLSSSKVKK